MGEIASEDSAVPACPVTAGRHPAVAGKARLGLGTPVAAGPEGDLLAFLFGDAGAHVLERAGLSLIMGAGGPRTQARGLLPRPGDVRLQSF